MKSAVIFTGCFFVLLGLQGQNLVLNPGFEYRIGCPNLGNWNLGSIDSAMYWTQPFYSSDYFYPCTWNSTHSTPQNALGYQQPKNGIAYAGIYGYLYGDGVPPDYREYVEGTLSTPLLKDSVYKIEFYISLAEKNSSVASDRIGAYLSNELIKYNIVPPNPHDVLPFKPQISSLKGYALSDSVGWMRICGYFKADGGENYITIGNYSPNADVSYLVLNDNFPPQSYYYVDDVSVELSPLNPYQWASNKTICTEDSSIQYILPDSLMNILWSTGDTTPTVSIQGAGAFWVQATLDGCQFIDTFHIEYTPAPAFSFSDDTIKVCGSTLPLVLETTDCCTEVLWSTGDTSKITEIQQEGLVWISQLNLCGSSRDSFWLKVDQPLAPNLGADTALCDTLQFKQVLQAPEGFTDYLWSTGDTASAITVTQPGLYSLIVRNECGVFTDTVNFKNLHQIQLEANNDTSLCLKAPLLLSASPGFDTYLWNTGEIARQIVVDSYGMYVVEATNECGTKMDSVSVSESNHPYIQLPEEIEVSLGDSVWLSPFVSHDKPLVFQWSPVTGLNCPVCENTVAFPLQTTDFFLIAIDSLGCQGEANVRLLVADRKRIYVPNVFSPNDDGQNDLLTVSFGNEVEQILSAAIFDRWGGLIVSRQNIPAIPETMLWDGSWLGKDAMPGVYTLVLVLRLKNNEFVRITSDITLVR